MVETDMLPGINIEISFDECETSLWIQGNNGSFAGEVYLYYVARDTTVEFADAISGFPASSDDSRIFELGTFDSSNAGGGVAFQFYCTDSVGHAVVEVRMRTEQSGQDGFSESAEFLLPVDAAGIDIFVAALRRMQVNADVVAKLRQAS